MGGTALKELGVVGIDTNIFIYVFERHELYGERALSLLKSVEDGSVRGTTTTITLAELVVRPLAARRDLLARAYREKIVGIRNLEIAVVDADLAFAAARARAAYPLRLPDAIQLAGAKRGRARAFITNDRRLAKLGSIEGLRILTLDDLRL